MNTWSDGVVGIVPNRTRVIIIYPTVDPQIVVVPIISSIVIFPIVAFLVICCLRKMAARRRQLARLAQSVSVPGDKFGEGTTTVDLMTPDPPDYTVIINDHTQFNIPPTGTNYYTHI
ncbi:hypothetical protein Fcan01_08832 [Folsomia candida]|uniref:Uncharacterized protein n=1 Tax=Folsomia candida TaxID=158441 RepID=A0A226EFA2_FOLCA|nr:hypothetical protein Fcan01_08832 [Folsomia candida]